MKQWTRLGLCTALLAAALACTALAAEGEGSVYGTGGVSWDGTKCTVTCTDGLTNGNQYVLLMVKDPDSINDEGVMYIDQAAAVDGAVTFEDFIPKDLPGDGQTWTALLGGEFSGETSPKEIGTLTFGYGLPVNGTVTLQGRTNYTGATVTLTGESSFTAATGADGAYSFSSVAPGTYTMTITMPGYLSHTINDLAVSGAVTVPDKSLLGGDVNKVGDGYINADDLSVILEYFTQEAPYPGADVNGDSYINAEELSLILNNFTKIAVVE